MTREENVRAILESCFAGFKEELIENAVNHIMTLEQELEIHFYRVKPELNRVKNELNSATNNDLADDCISRKAVLSYIGFIQNHGLGKKKSLEYLEKFISNLPPEISCHKEGEE